MRSIFRVPVPVLVCLLLTAAAFPARSYAQSGARVAVGVEITKRIFPDGDFHRGVGPGLLYRIPRHRRPENGWRFRAPQFGFNWFHVDVTMPVGGQETGLGRLRVRPLLAGVAEALVMNDGRDELSFSLLTGPAFTRFDVSADARNAYRQRLGADPIAIDAKTTWVLGPGVSYWHDLSPRFGLHGGLNYTIARPTIVTRTSGGESTERWNADNVALKAGVAVKVF